MIFAPRVSSASCVRPTGRRVGPTGMNTGVFDHPVGVFQLPAARESLDRFENLNRKIHPVSVSGRANAIPQRSRDKLRTCRANARTMCRPSILGICRRKTDCNQRHDPQSEDSMFSRTLAPLGRVFRKNAARFVATGFSRSIVPVPLGQHHQKDEIAQHHRAHTHGQRCSAPSCTPR